MTHKGTIDILERLDKIRERLETAVEKLEHCVDIQEEEKDDDKG